MVNILVMVIKDGLGKIHQHLVQIWTSASDK